MHSYLRLTCINITEKKKHDKIWVLRFNFATTNTENNSLTMTKKNVISSNDNDEIHFIKTKNNNNFYF